MILFNQIDNLNLCDISKYDLCVHEIDNSIEYFYYSDDKKHKSNNINIKKYYKCYIYIHEINNNIENSYYPDDKKNKKLYNKKKMECFEKISNNPKKYYKCIFLDFSIVKITNECIVIISRCILNNNNKRMDIFNNLNLFIEWLFSSGYFSNDVGCSCERCNDVKIEEYKKQFNIEITKKQIINEITNILL